MNNLFTELKRRNVFRVGAAYLVVGWLIIEIVDTLAPRMAMPEWVPGFVILLVLAGFPITLLAAWAFELTPDGVKKTKDVVADTSVTATTGQKLNYVIIGALALALGYFVLERQEPDQPAAPPPVSEETTEAQKTIAVLPFQNMSGSDENDPFTNGLHDDLLTQLAKIGGISVISRTSVGEYRGTTKNLRTIGEELGAATIMEGGVQRSGDRVRINVQLIDAASDEHLWAETYDRVLSVAEIFDIQSEISAAIATALRSTLTDAEEDAIGNLPTTNMAAYDAYLRGKAATGRWYAGGSAELHNEIVAAYAEAVELDPKFVLAHAELGSAHALRFTWLGREAKDLVSALDAINVALALDPALPEAHFAKARYYGYGFLDYENSTAELELARTGMAGDARFHSFYIGMVLRQGRWEEALVSARKAAQLSPLDSNAWMDLASVLSGRRRYADATAAYEKARLIDPKNQFIVVRLAELEWHTTGKPGPLLDEYLAMRPIPEFAVDRAWLYLQFTRRYDEALALIDEYESVLGQIGISNSPSFYRGFIILYRDGSDAAQPHLEVARQKLKAQLADQPENRFARASLAYVYAALDMRDEAISLIMTLPKMQLVTRDVGRTIAANRQIALVYALLGEQNEALAWMDRYLEKSEVSLAFSLSGPTYDGSIGTPAREALTEKYGLVHKDLSEGGTN